MTRVPRGALACALATTVVFAACGLEPEGSLPVVVHERAAPLVVTLDVRQQDDAQISVVAFAAGCEQPVLALLVDGVPLQPLNDGAEVLLGNADFGYGEHDLAARASCDARSADSAPTHVSLAKPPPPVASLGVIDQTSEAITLVPTLERCATVASLSLILAWGDQQQTRKAVRGEPIRLAYSDFGLKAAADFSASVAATCISPVGTVAATPVRFSLAPPPAPPAPPSMTLTAQPLLPRTAVRFNWASSGCTGKVALVVGGSRGVGGGGATGEAIVQGLQFDVEAGGTGGGQVIAVLTCDDARSATASSNVTKIVRGQSFPWAPGAAPQAQPLWVRALASSLLYCDASGQKVVEVAPANGAWAAVGETPNGCEWASLAGRWLWYRQSTPVQALGGAEFVPPVIPEAAAPLGSDLVLAAHDSGRAVRVDPSGRTIWDITLPAEARLLLPEGNGLRAVGHAYGGGSFANRVWVGLISSSGALSSVYSWWTRVADTGGDPVWLNGSVFVHERSLSGVDLGWLQCTPGQSTCTASGPPELPGAPTLPAVPNDALGAWSAGIARTSSGGTALGQAGVIEVTP